MGLFIYLFTELLTITYDQYKACLQAYSLSLRTKSLMLADFKVACNAGDQRTAYNIKVHVFEMYKICIKSAGHSIIRTHYYEKMNTTLNVKLLSQQHFC